MPTELVARVRLVRGDVRDQELLERALGEYQVATVIHLAAQTVVGVANRNPVSTLDTNVRGTWALLEAARRSPLVRQVVVASSDKAYGDQDVLPYTEDAPLRGRHPYDVSKSCADLLAQMYATSFGLPVCVTRCGNFFGGGDLNWSRLVPGTIRSVLRGERPVIRSDGRFVRDYLYVEDGARAYLRLAEQMDATPALAGEVFNFSYERRLTVLDLVQRVLAAMESPLEPDVRNEAVNEIRDQYLDASKAQARAGLGARVRSRPGPAAPRSIGTRSTSRVPDQQIPVVILCGGAGTRLAEQTEVRPKPLVEVGGRPILWHIMKHYSHYGFNEFVLALGYKGDQIKRYFMDYQALGGDMTISLADGQVVPLTNVAEPWKVHLVDTGEGDADRRTAAPASAAHRRPDVHADVRRRRGRRSGSTTCWRSIAPAAAS